MGTTKEQQHQNTIDGGVNMNEFHITIGLFDRLTECQEISTAEAAEIITNTLINDFGIYAFTMIECKGVYRMESTGCIVQEPSFRIEIAAEEALPVYDIVGALKIRLNQESVMLKCMQSKIEFI